MAESTMDNLQQGVKALTIQDADPLNREIIDAISKRLNENWKDFARKILEEYKVIQIDSDHRSMYDKCYAMFQIWEKDSPAQVTIAMVKLHLKSLNRNDVLLDVFQGGRALPVSQQQQQYHESNSRSIDDPDGPVGVKISDLRQKHKSKLKSLLDPDHGAGIKNWLHLGLELVARDKELSRKIEDFKLDYAGGGSPAKAFLDALAINQPEVTVKEFQTTANELERNDIVVYLKKLKGDDQLRQIECDHKDKIASMLNKQIHGINDWRHFADEYGYKNHEIDNFKTAIKLQESYSPTVKLLELIQKWEPNMLLTDISTTCSQLQRNDVALCLKGIISELTP